MIIKTLTMFFGSILFLTGCNSNQEKTEAKIQLSEAAFLYSLCCNKNDSAFLNAFNHTRTAYGTSNENFIGLFGKTIEKERPNCSLAGFSDHLNLKTKSISQQTISKLSIF